jgi:peptidoglycan hydrolase-like amidase
VAVKEKEIASGEKELGDQQDLLGKRVRAAYIRSFTNNPLVLFFSQGQDFSKVMRVMSYQQAVTQEDKRQIMETVALIKNIEDKKTALVNEKVTLANLSANLEVQASATKKLVDEAKAYEAKLSSQIGALTVRQQSFLAEKLAGLNIPLFAISGGGCSSDLTNGKDPGFSGGFGFFSYGVPNRVGLNQYGAWGRAKKGQGYEDILHAYYNFDSIENRSATIKVDGYGSYSLDDYVKRVYEVPDSWTDNDLAALKAQAIAVRSYALAYTNNGSGSICTTQQCQVFKPDSKGGNWETAVNATSGKVMIQGGQPIKAFFSSTHGGYVYATGDLAGWSQTSYTKRAVDSSNGSYSNFGDMKSNAYDRDSPWFYCDWGARSAYSGTAWLKSDEVADIVNVILLSRADSGTQEHLYQPDKSNPEGKETWDQGRVKQELKNRNITPYNNVDNVSASGIDWGTGRTTQVSVSGDEGSQSFDGSEFKSFFNLRAPANIQIVGPLYNVERK